MKKWWFGERKHIDEEKREREAAALKDLRWLMDNGCEQDYIAYVTRLKPEMSATELQTLISEFHIQRSARRSRV